MLPSAELSAADLSRLLESTEDETLHRGTLSAGICYFQSWRVIP